METKDNVIIYRDNKYIIVNKTRYLGHNYIFVININDYNDVKLLICKENLEEVTDLELIRNVVINMPK